MKLKVVAILFALALLACAPAATRAQEENAKPKSAEARQERTRKPDERLEPDDKSVTRSDMPAETMANRIEQRSEEEASVVPYYNNFLSEYLIGPEDVISVSVFGHERYSRPSVVIPPNGVLAYPLIPEGVLVAGKTTRQIADEIAVYLDEYIIDPKVTVTLEKAQSMRYAVLGDVGQPGMRLMTRRLTVYEALLEAGGVLNTGNKKKVVLVRYTPDRRLDRRLVDIAAIERGKAPDNIFLAPGDQIFVPGNKLKTVNKILDLVPIISFARIFTGGW